MPNEALKILGPLSILLTVVAGLLLVRMWPQGRKSSISRHGGMGGRKAYWLYALTLTISGVLFYIFGRWWLAPTLGLVNLFNILLFAGLLLQLVTAWVPDRGDKSPTSQLHARAAFSMAVVMMLLSGCVALATNAPLAVKVLGGAVFMAMGLLWYLFLFVRKTRKQFLVYQTAYIVMFYALILAATYLR